MTALDSSATAAVTRRVVLMSVVAGLAMVAIKAVAWKASGSVAVLASLADSSLNLLAGLTTFIYLRFFTIPPDTADRFGQNRAEAFSSLVQGGLAFAAAALVGREAIAGLFDPRPAGQQDWAVGLMAASLMIALGLAVSQTRLLRKARPAASGAHGHHAAHIVSHLLALAGVTAAAFGAPAVDAAAGLAVTALILWSALVIFREAADELMDHEAPAQDRAKIKAIALRDPEVLGVALLRTRAAGPFVHILMHLELAPDLSLNTAHQVILACERRLLAAYPGGHITIHADPQGRAPAQSNIFADTIG